jgi:hypothetical protein
MRLIDLGRNDRADVRGGHGRGAWRKGHDAAGKSGGRKEIECRLHALILSKAQAAFLSRTTSADAWFTLASRRRRAARDFRKLSLSACVSSPWL